MKFTPYRSLMMILLTAIAAVSLVACTKTPQLTEGGKGVEYVENVEIIQDKLDDPEKCTLKVSLEVKATVAVGLTESRKKNEQKRRLVRARNLAAENDANLIIRDGELEDNTQKFKAYHCK